MDLNQLQQQLAEQQGKIPPVEKWDPAFCGEIDLVIKHDGSWFYMGTPIGRKAMVKLFASVIRKDDDRYVLVTPVEKVGIQVEDVPFVITQWERRDSLLVFSTQTDDSFVVGDEHPVEIHQDAKTQAWLPYVLVRRNLWARLHQNVYYQLVEIANPTHQGDQQQLMLSSGDYTFSLGSY
ncbi:DUF1285 domain-containing protein [Aliiglaciecola litoralis]|uniref:DUF1285 domain-containing protein n=1 Tax=Aliiglaciecola litoralis TaxID=582857 RepID=A0ABN1LF64_9ALTE